jgi:hypothetical protein
MMELEMGGWFGDIMSDPGSRCEFREGVVCREERNSLSRRRDIAGAAAVEFLNFPLLVLFRSEIQV